MAFKKREQLANAQPRPEIHSVDVQRGLHDGRDAIDLDDTLDIGTIWRDASRKAVYRQLGAEIASTFKESRNAFTAIDFVELYDKMDQTPPVTLTPRERILREEVRREYVRREALAHRCRELIDTPTVEGLLGITKANGDKSPISILAGSVGIEKSVALMKQQLGVLAGTKDGDVKLRNLYSTLERINVVQQSKEYKKIHDKVEAVKKKHDLTPGEYYTFTRGTYTENAQNVRSYLNENVGILGKIYHSVGNFRKSHDVANAAYHEGKSAAMKTITDGRRQVLKILSTVLDESFFAHVDAEAVAATSSTDLVKAVKDADEQKDKRLASETTIVNEQTRMESEFNKFIGSGPFDYNGGWVDWDLLPPSVQDNEFNGWLQSEYKNTRNQEIQASGGRWSKFFAMLFGVRLNKLKKPSPPTPQMPPSTP